LSEDLDVKTYLKGQHPKEKFKIGNNLYKKGFGSLLGRVNISYFVWWSFEKI